MFRILFFLLCIQVTLAQETKLDSISIIAINEETLALRLDGKYKEALALNDRLLDSIKAHTTSIWYAKTLHTRSRVEIDLGRYNTAIVHAKQAKNIYKGFSKYTEVAATDNIIGVGFYFKSEMDSTLHYYNKSYRLKQKHEKDTIQLAISVFNIGIVYEDQGKYEKAIAAYSEAEDLLMAASEKAGFMSDLYVALSNVYRSRNDLVKSKSYAQLALKETIENYGEDNPSTSFVYVSNAGLYRAMGDDAGAKPFLKKALELRKKYYGADHRWTVESYRSLAETYLNLHHIDSALQSINTAIAISKKNSYSLDIANNYIEKARILIEDKQWKEALTLTGNSRDLYLDIFGKTHQYIAESYFLEATVNYNLKDTSRTREILKKVYKVAKYTPTNLTTLNAPFIVAKSLHMEFELSTTPSEKMLLIDEQISLINHIKNYYQTPEAKLFYNATTTSNISDYVAFCYKAFSITKSKKYFNKALALVQLATNSVLAQERQNVSETKTTLQGEQLFNRLSTVRQQWAKINQDLYYEETEIAPNKTLLDSLLEKKQEISLRLDETLEAYQAISSNTSNELTILTVEEIQEILNSEQQLLQYYVGKEALYVFHINENDYQLIYLGEVSKMNSLVNSFRKQLITREEINFQIRNLSSYLLPESLKIKSKHLIIIPDGILAYVPFEVLTDTSEKPLLDSQNISYQAALSFLKSVSRTNKYSNYWAGFGVAYKGVQSLPKGTEEVKTIAKLTKGQAYLNSAATKQQLFIKAKESKILHLALHGIVDENNPLYSTFLLENETVTASEIYNQQIASNLVVLSACETGYGTLQKGEGVMSLSRAFTYAGAASTLMSLWEVPDQQTAQLMTHFYTYLKEGYAKDEALRKAKLTFVNEASTTYLKHPYYWAGFVVSGDVAPIESFAVSFKHLGWIGLCGALLVLGFIFLRKRSANYVQ